MLARLLIIPSTVLCLLSIGYVVFTTGIHPRSYSNPSGSMAPTIVPGEMIFASGGFYKSHAPVPGDIALFNVPGKESSRPSSSAWSPAPEIASSWNEAAST